jgi:hypothetical protein
MPGPRNTAYKNGSNLMDARDLPMLVEAFGESIGDGHCNPVFDLHHDGAADVIDPPTLVLVCDFGSQDRRMPVARHTSNGADAFRNRAADLISGERHKPSR